MQVRILSSTRTHPQPNPIYDTPKLKAQRPNRDKPHKPFSFLYLLKNDHEHCIPMNGIKTLEEIHRELWEKSRQQEPFNQLDQEEVTKTIKQNAGLDTRTVDKYWEELKTLDRIEEIPRLGRWRISQPRQTEIENTGKRARINIRVDQGLKNAAEQLGINMTSLLNKALSKEVSDTKNYVGKVLNANVSEQEADYIFNLVTQDLYRKKPSKEAEAKVDKQRRQVYKNTFNIQEVDSETYEHLEQLRLQAWELAEALGVQESH